MSVSARLIRATRSATGPTEKLSIEDDPSTTREAAFARCVIAQDGDPVTTSSSTGTEDRVSIHSTSFLASIL
jgi:hypothetical protein